VFLSVNFAGIREVLRTRDVIRSVVISTPRIFQNGHTHWLSDKVFIITSMNCRLKYQQFLMASQDIFLAIFPLDEIG